MPSRGIMKLGESAYVRLAHPVGDIHRLGSDHMGVAGNDGAYFPSALNSSPPMRSQLARNRSCSGRVFLWRYWSQSFAPHPLPTKRNFVLWITSGIDL